MRFAAFVAVSLLLAAAAAGAPLPEVSARATARPLVLGVPLGSPFSAPARARCSTR